MKQLMLFVSLRTNLQYEVKVYRYQSNSIFLLFDHLILMKKLQQDENAGEE